jgi:DNA invertase Pin-like site-specific DNA recombinase
MLRFVRKDDTLVVTRLDRLGRSAADLHAIAQQLQEKGVNLRVLDQSIDTSTSAGRVLFGMIAVFAARTRPDRGTACRGYAEVSRDAQEGGAQAWTGEAD